MKTLTKKIIQARRKFSPYILDEFTTNFLEMQRCRQDNKLISTFIQESNNEQNFRKGNGDTGLEFISSGKVSLK